MLKTLVIFMSIMIVSLISLGISIVIAALFLTLDPDYPDRCPNQPEAEQCLTQ